MIKKIFKKKYFFKFSSSFSSFFHLFSLTSQWSSSTWCNNGTINAALSQDIVHVTEPPQTGTSALSFTAAGPDSTVVLVRLSPASPVTSTADKFMFWTGTAIISQTTDLTRLATVFVLAVLPIVEWFPSIRVFSDVISTWAGDSSVGVGGVVGTGDIVGEVDSFDSVFAVWTWAIVGDGLDRVPEVVVTFFSGPTERPDSMSRFVPVVGVFTESHSEASVALADSSSAVVFDGFGVVVWPPTVVTDDTSFGIVVFVVDIPEESVRVPSDVGVARTEIVFGASVTVPQLLANFINDIYWWSPTGDETVSTFWQAPAPVETVPGNTFIFWL